MLGALPCLTINLLSHEENLHSPFYHYSLAIAPFVFLAVISALATRSAWLSRPWMVGAWLALVILGGGLARGAALAQQTPDEPSRAERQALVDMVGDTGGVLSTHQLTSHLMHREMAYYVFDPAGEPGMHFPRPAPSTGFYWISTNRASFRPAISAKQCSGNISRIPSSFSSAAAVGYICSTGSRSKSAGFAFGYR